MKSNWIFYLGVIINAGVLLFAISNGLMMHKNFDGIDGKSISPMEGMPLWSQYMIWVIPIALILLIITAFWLKSIGKMMGANILLWITGLPILVMFILWGGLALLFILFGK